MNNDTIKIISKEDKLIELYSKRSKMFDSLAEAYEAKKDYFRIVVLTANMERIHYGSMMGKVFKVKELNEEQRSGRYNLERELEIGKLSKGLCNSDWDDSEKKTMVNYHNKMENYNNKFREKMTVFVNIQRELHDQTGNEITATISNPNPEPLTNCRGEV